MASSSTLEMRPAGSVLGALTALVLDHVALVVERLLETRAVEQEPHPVALQPQRELELVGRHDLEVVGSILRGRAVDVGGARLLQVLEVLVLRDVLRPLEHHVLEQVGEAGAPRGFVARADLVPDVDHHLGHAVILVQDHLEAVRQGVLLEVDLGEVRRGRFGRGAGDDKRERCRGSEHAWSDTTRRRPDLEQRAIWRRYPQM